jgi:hypothetical protein
MSDTIFTFSPKFHTCRGLRQEQVTAGLRELYFTFCIDFCLLSDRILKVGVAGEWEKSDRSSPYHSQVNGGIRPSTFSVHSSVHTHRANTTKLLGLSPRVNYTDRATAACRRSYYQLLWTECASHVNFQCIYFLLKMVVRPKHVADNLNKIVNKEYLFFCPSM